MLGRFYYVNKIPVYSVHTIPSHRIASAASWPFAVLPPFRCFSRPSCGLCGGLAGQVTSGKKILLAESETDATFLFGGGDGVSDRAGGNLIGPDVASAGEAVALPLAGLVATFGVTVPGEVAVDVKLGRFGAGIVQGHGGALGYVREEKPAYASCLLR